jgi:hypothetical protein
MLAILVPLALATEPEAAPGADLPLPAPTPTSARARPAPPPPPGPRHLYLGTDLPLAGFGYSSQGNLFLALDVAPVAVEAPLNPRLGLRLDVDVSLEVSPITAVNGTQLTVSLPYYCGRLAPSQGMRGFFVGPAVAVEVAGSNVAAGGGLSLGFSGRLTPDVLWRTGLWFGLGVDRGGITPMAGVTLLEIGWFLPGEVG